MSEGPRQSYDRFIFSENILADLIKKGAQGKFLERHENVPLFYRASVVAVDVQGAKLENPDGSGEVVHEIDGKSTTTKARRGPKNPMNSVKARILTNGLDQFVDDENLRVYWPLFDDHTIVPIKPGEHVYVMFEDQEFKHGLWINKVPGHEGVNYVKGESLYKDPGDGKLSGLFGMAGQSAQEDQKTDKYASESKIKDQNLSSKFGIG